MKIFCKKTKDQKFQSKKSNNNIFYENFLQKNKRSKISIKKIQQQNYQLTN